MSSSHREDQLGWNETSRRYVTENNQFYIPLATEWRGKPANAKQGSSEPIPAADGERFMLALESYCDLEEQWYNKAMDEGIAPEQARLFLPAYGLYIRWRWTASLNSVLHMLTERIPHDAQKEIHDYAEAVRTETRVRYPSTARWWEEYALEKGP